MKCLRVIIWAVKGTSDHQFSLSEIFFKILNKKGGKKLKKDGKFFPTAHASTTQLHSIMVSLFSHHDQHPKHKTNAILIENKRKSTHHHLYYNNE